MSYASEWISHPGCIEADRNEDNGASMFMWGQIELGAGLCAASGPGAFIFFRDYAARGETIIIKLASTLKTRLRHGTDQAPTHNSPMRQARSHGFVDIEAFEGAKSDIYFVPTSTFINSNTRSMRGSVPNIDPG